MENETTQTTLRDTIENAFDEHIEPAPAAVTPPPEPVLGETPEQKADRLRDDKGRFVEGKPLPKADTKVVAPDTTKGDLPKPRPQRPSSWKKEMWDHWEKLDPNVADYLHQREQEYSKGVSAYKSEWENVRPVIEALNQFQPLMQQFNIKPTEWITNLGNAHRVLVQGSPQQRMQMFAKLAQDYQVPLQELLSQGELQPNNPIQYINPLYERVNQLEGRLHSWQSQQEQQEQRTIATEIENFKAQHPHVDEVRATMAGLLQSGLAENLNDAYDAALRHPKHANIYDAIQQQNRQQDEAKRLEEATKRAKSAKANAVSPRTATPSAPGFVNGKKGLRDQLSDNFDEIVGGRV